MKINVKRVLAKTNVKDDPITPIKNKVLIAGIPLSMTKGIIIGRGRVKSAHERRAGLTLWTNFLFKIKSIAPKTADPKANQNHIYIL